MDIIKRNGTKEEFCEQKIINAIQKANSDVPKRHRINLSNVKILAEKVREECEKSSKAKSVEAIQDIIENLLIKMGASYVAKAFITYRYKRGLVREFNTTDKTIKELLDGESDYWNHENSNKNATVVTVQRDYLAGITSTDITTRLLLPEDIVEAHKQGIIHFHDADYFAQRTLHNCFARSTKFITKQGLKSFNDFNDGDEIEVLSIDGAYHKAVVKRYGIQPLYKYTFYNGKKEFTHEVLATENHRWILKDGTVTTNLSIGDKLCKPPVIYQQELDWDKLNDNEKMLWCKGFAVGDGTKECGTNSTKIRICQEKVPQYLSRFNIEGCNIRNTTFGNGDKEVVVYNYKKEIPRFDAIKELQCFLNGLYCADGRKIKTNTGKYNFSIQSSSLEVVNFLRQMSGTAGLYLTRENERTGEKTNFTSESGRSYTILFSFNNDFFFNYTVLNKEYYGKEEVWCLEVEDTHNFVLEYGIPTGNCELINLDDCLQNGTIINGVMIEKPHRFLTAATIATQIITAVSSSSYGGATISLTHLAPFVRSSYNYYYKKYEARGESEENCKKFATEDTKKEIVDGVQTFNYQVNSMTNTNGQAPFLSVCMYLGETKDYKQELALLIEEFLKQRMIGFKNEKGVWITPAFPKLLYVLEEDNIRPDSKYFYLTELAAKCTAKRMTPDYISEKIMLRVKINKEGDGECYPCMGCRSFLTPDRYMKNISRAKNYEDNKGKYYGRLTTIF